MKENYQVSSFPYFISNKKGCTKFEENFFEATDHCYLCLDFESGKCSLDDMMLKINQAYHGFKQEIIENSTLFNTDQRSRYLNRLLLMVNDIHDTWISQDPEKGKSLRIQTQLFMNGVNIASLFDAYLRVIAENKKNYLN